jgi:hypothetical protein
MSSATIAATAPASSASAKAVAAWPLARLVQPELRLAVVPTADALDPIERVLVDPLLLHCAPLHERARLSERVAVVVDRDRLAVRLRPPGHRLVVAASLEVRDAAEEHVMIGEESPKPPRRLDRALQLVPLLTPHIRLVGVERLAHRRPTPSFQVSPQRARRALRFFFRRKELRRSLASSVDMYDSPSSSRFLELLSGREGT